MKVSDQNSSQSTRLTDEKKEERRRSERFSEFIRERDRKDLRRRNRANDSDFATAQTNSPSTVNVANLPLLVHSENNSVAPQETTAKQHPDINKLAAEILRQFEMIHYGGKVQGVNLTFSSKALQGLQVQIRQHQDNIAIRFVSPSESLSRLLTQNTDQLHETLSQKGVQVKGIAVSTQAHGDLSEFTDFRTREQNAE